MFVTEPVKFGTRIKSMHTNGVMTEVQLHRPASTSKNNLLARQKYNQSAHRIKQADGNRFKSLPIYHSLAPSLHNSSRRPSSRKQSFVRMTRQFSTITARCSPEIKWQKFLEGYYEIENEKEMENAKCKIKPGLVFYELLLKYAEKGGLRLNFPETAMADREGNWHLLFTSQGQLKSKLINKFTLREQFAIYHNQFLKQVVLHRVGLNNLDEPGQQPLLNTPFIIEKRLKPQRDKDNNINERPYQFETTVFTHKSFEENRPKPSSESVLQHFVFSRNMKPMIYRVYYHRQERNQQHEQYHAYRYQNISGILTKPVSLNSTIQAYPNRIGQVELTKLVNNSSLQKFIEPTQQLRRHLQKHEKVVINNLEVDYLLDLFDRVWLINLKYISLEKGNSCEKQHRGSVTACNVSTCRLCLQDYKKSELNRSISTKMFLEFLEHLKRRTTVDHFKNIPFVDEFILNRKECAIMAVCQFCYTIIIKELELIDWETQLAKLCHIKSEVTQAPIKECAYDCSDHPVSMYQWRLMVYMETISNCHCHSENMTVRYLLGRDIEEKWKCRPTSFNGSTLQVNQVKIHYFFSESLSIDQFIKNTQITISVMDSSSDREEIVALGSTGVISNLKNKFEISNGQRQTSTVLLFFENHKYCELVLKIGVVCDGKYHVQDQQFKKWNSVYFAHKNYINSNPLPKEWMEIFGEDCQIKNNDLMEQQIVDVWVKKQQPSRRMSRDNQIKCMLLPNKPRGMQQQTSTGYRTLLRKKPLLGR